MKSITLLICLICSQFTYSQSLNAINFRIGKTFPLRNFTTGDIYGSTRIGNSRGVTYKRKLNHYISFITALQSTKNGIDFTTLAKRLVATQADGKVATISSTPWKTFSSLIGFEFDHSIGESKFKITSKSLIGVSHIRTPYVIITHHTVSLDRTGSQVEEGKINSLAFQIGIGSNYLITEQCSITLDIDYFATNAKTKQANSIDSFKFKNRERDSNPYKQSVHILATKIGLTYQF